MATVNGCGLCKVKVDRLGVVRGSNILLEDISFELHCGEFTALIGVNGAGKTTLLRAILGEIRHNGTVTYESFDGTTLNDITIGYVPQYLDFDRSIPMSVEDFLLAGRTSCPVCFVKPHKLRNSVKESLEAADCADLAKRTLGELSGGELQKVMLAQAIFPVPELLILDEPVSGVDTVATERFYESIAQLRKKYHMAIAMVSHDLELVRHHADKVLLINKYVLKQGDVNEVFNSVEFRKTFSTGGGKK